MEKNSSEKNNEEKYVSSSNNSKNNYSNNRNNKNRSNNDNHNNHSKISYYHRRKLRYQEVSQKETKNEEDITIIKSYETFLSRRRHYNLTLGKKLRDLENKGDADAKMRMDKIRSTNRKSKQNMYAAKSKRRKEIMALNFNDMNAAQRKEYYEILEERKKRNEYLKNKRLKDRKAKEDAMKEELVNSLVALHESSPGPLSDAATDVSSTSTFLPPPTFPSFDPTISKI